MNIYLSMTTIAARNGLLGPTLESIATQTLQPYAVYISGGPGVSFGDDLWVTPGIYDKIFFKTASSFNFHKLGVDRGPIHKLQILEESFLKDDDLIVTVDDDIIYSPDWLQTLVGASLLHPDSAVGLSGWNTYDFLRAAKDGDPSGGDYVFPQPGPCDVLEGWAGVAYRKRFFEYNPYGEAAVLYPPQTTFRNVDDVWIASELHRRGVERRIVGYGGLYACERPNPPPGLHNLPYFVELNRRAVLAAFGGAG